MSYFPYTVELLPSFIAEMLLRNEVVGNYSTPLWFGKEGKVFPEHNVRAVMGDGEAKWANFLNNHRLCAITPSAPIAHLHCFNQEWGGIWRRRFAGMIDVPNILEAISMGLWRHWNSQGKSRTISLLKRVEEVVMEEMNLLEVPHGPE